MHACVCINSFNKPGGPGEQGVVGIKVHAGSWVGQCQALTVKSTEENYKSVCWRGGGGGGWAARANPVEKLHRRRRRTRNKLRGNSIKKGGCQSGLSWLPHPLLCAKFQERLSPCSRVCVCAGGRLK